MLLVDSPARLCLNRGSRGDIAQLIERSIRIAEVEGLNPSISTRCYYIYSDEQYPVAIFIIHSTSQLSIKLVAVSSASTTATPLPNYLVENYRIQDPVISARVGGGVLRIQTFCHDKLRFY